MVNPYSLIHTHLFNLIQTTVVVFHLISPYCCLSSPSIHSWGQAFKNYATCMLIIQNLLFNKNICLRKPLFIAENTQCALELINTHK